MEFSFKKLTQGRGHGMALLSVAAHLCSQRCHQALERLEHHQFRIPSSQHRADVDPAVPSCESSEEASATGEQDQGEESG